jgi:hypothetical protein
MKVHWIQRLILLLLWNLLGGAAFYGFCYGIEYGSKHWWHGTNLAVGLVLMAPVFLAQHLLGISQTNQGVSSTFAYSVYGVMGFILFLAIGIAWQTFRRLK